MGGGLGGDIYLRTVAFLLFGGFGFDDDADDDAAFFLVVGAEMVGGGTGGER